MRSFHEVYAGRCPYSIHRAPALHGRASASGGRIGRVQLELSAIELETAARACRALAYQEGERAKKMENPGMREPIERAARQFAALAERFDQARKSPKAQRA